MSMTPVFHATVGANGRLVWHDPEAASKHTRDLKIGTRVVVTIEPLRSLDANDFYWVVCEATATATGDTRHNVHKGFKQRFLAPQPDGTYTTRNLSKQQFNDYLDQCIVLALEYGAKFDQSRRAAA
jgi:hypothetical protein